MPKQISTTLLLILAVFAGASAWAIETRSVPLTLREAVEEALANNLNLKLRQEDTRIAAGSVEIATSRFDKLLNAEGDVTSTESTSLITGNDDQEDIGKVNVSLSKRFTTGTEVQLGWANNRDDIDSDAVPLELNPSYGSNVSLSISQPVLRGGSSEIQTAPISAAEKDLEAATYQVDDLAADLASQVKNSYWNLVFAWQDIEVKKLSLTLAKKLLEETEAKIAAGKLAQVELYQPQSEVARREEDLIASERAIGAADDNLKLLLNSSDWYASFTPVDLPATEPIEIVPEAVLDNALSSRPDLKAAKVSIDAARIRQDIAEDDLRPELNLIGGLGYGGTDEGYGDAVDAAFDDPDTSWQVGFNFTMPLDNSAAWGALQQARASHTKARTNLQLLHLQTTKEVRATVRDVRLAIKAMEATRKTSLATLKRLEAEQAKFDAGRSTTLDVLIAQEAYSQALSQENRTNIVYAQSLAELDRIQGLITFSSAN